MHLYYTRYGRGYQYFQGFRAFFNCYKQTLLSIFAMLFEGVIVFRNLKNKLHAYLFLNCITMLVNNTGYLLELLSKTEDGHIAALKFSYAGRAFILFSIIMVSAELCHISISKLLVRALLLIDVFVYAIIFTFQNHDLYYSKIWYDKTGMFPVLLQRAGIVHKAFMQYQAVVIVIVLAMLFRSIKYHKGKIAKKGKISVDKYIEKKYLETDGKVSGYITGLQMANKYGFTTQNPACYEVCSNEASTKQRRQEIDGNTIVVYKPVADISEENKTALQFLDGFEIVNTIKINNDTE